MTRPFLGSEGALQAKVAFNMFTFAQREEVGATCQSLARPAPQADGRGVGADITRGMAATAHIEVIGNCPMRGRTE